MPRTRPLGLTLAIATALALSACGSATTNTASSSSTAPGPSALASATGTVEVTFWHALGGATGAALQKLVDQFNTAHQGKIQVNAVYQGSYTDMLAKYSTSVRSHTTPSMLTMYDVGTGFMVDAKQTIAAQDLAVANPGDLNLNDLQPAARRYYTVNGKQLSVPFNSSTPLLYVNWDMLKQAGLSTSTPLSSLAEIAAAAQKVKDAGVGSGFTQPYDGWFVEQLTSASGTTLCTPDNGRQGSPVTAINLTGAAQQQALSTIAALYRDGAALDTGTDGNQAVAAFNAGKVAMMINSSGAAGSVRTNAAFSWQALPYPTSGPKDTAGPIIGGASLWVSAVGHTSAEQVASWQLISFLDSPASQAAFSTASGYVPVNTKTATDPSYQATLAAHPELNTALAQLTSTPAGTATAGCLTGALTAVRTDVVSALQAGFSGKTPLSDALQAAQTKANSDISSYLQQVGK